MEETAYNDGKRGQIIEAAIEEFGRDGFAGVSMDRVAARANVSKRTVYNHFESKEALFRAILDLLADKSRQALTIQYRPGEPIEGQLWALGRAEGALLTSPEFMRLARMVVGETMRDPVLAAETNERMAHAAVFHGFMAAAAADGALRLPDPTSAGEQFLGLLKAQAFWPYVFSQRVVEQEEMTTVIAATVEMFMKTYAA